jgi:predicted hydrocarbon binding protein
MIVIVSQRKHIAIEPDYIKKLQPLIDKHHGNLSAAIRDAIELTEIALQYYDSIDDARSLITNLKEIQDDQVIIQAPVFHWLLQKEKGLIIDKQTLDYMIDPFSITTIPELQEYVNNMCRDFGWHVETMIDCDDNDHPVCLSITLNSNYKERIYFLAIIMCKFLAVYKSLGIISVHPQLGELEIELRQKKTNDEAIQDLIDNLGYMVHIEKELASHSKFWNRLIGEHSASNYNLVTIHRNFYEDLLIGKIPKAILTIEGGDSRPLEEMPLSQFLYTIKTVAETSRIVDKIYVEGDNLKIRHGFRNMKAVENIKNIFISILERSGYNYSPEITSTYIYMKHLPMIDDKTNELFISLSGNINKVPLVISEFVKFIKTLDNIDFLEQVQAFGRRLGRQIMIHHEQKYGSKYWDLATFTKAFEVVDKQIRSRWEIRKSSMEYTVHECAYADDPSKCHMHKEIFKGALEYAFGSLAEVEIIKLLSHGDEYCDVSIHVR